MERCSTAQFQGHHDRHGTQFRLLLFETAMKTRQDVRSENNQRQECPVENNSMWQFLHHRRSILVTVHSHAHHHSRTSQSLSHLWAIAVRYCSGIMPKEPRVYFAVRVGRKPGIYTTWLHFDTLLNKRIIVNSFRDQGRLPRASAPLSSRGVQEDQDPR